MCLVLLRELAGQHTSTPWFLPLSALGCGNFSELRRTTRNEKRTTKNGKRPMSMQADFSGKRAIVTGGMRGIGRAIVNGLVKHGAEVHVFDLNVGGDRCDGFFTHEVNVADS